MDLHAAIGQFFNDKGDIALPSQITLAGLAEMMYQADAAQGGAGRHCMRFWDYSESREGVAHDFTRA